MPTVKRSFPSHRWLLAAFLFAVSFASGSQQNEEFERPNILWLSFEDTSAYFLPPYGNTRIETPTIQRLAGEGILFTQARAPAPHCSPARSSLISGTLAPTWGTDHHRQPRAVPHDRFYFPALLREAGYFTSNNQKTDYNVRDWDEHRDRVWDQHGNKATYNHHRRGAGQPFFAVFNQMSTHMGRIRSFHTEERRQFDDYSPASIDLPAHLPDLPDIRSDYSFQLEAIEDLDRWVKLFIDDLEGRKLKDDTLIFFFSDHGGPMPREKGYPFETGYRVPLIIWVPEKWSHLVALPLGEKTDRLVGFEDFGPTVLRLAGIEPPEHMHGRDFLTPKSEPKPYQFLFRTNHGGNYDPAHSVTDGTYMYTRFFRPHKPLSLRQSYQWGVPGYLAWDRAYREDPKSLKPEHAAWFDPTPSEYLVKLDADPWQVGRNLAGDPEHREVLETMRQALSDHFRETKPLSFFPFYMRTPAGPNTPLYNWVRETNYPLETLYEAAETASLGCAEAKDTLLEFLGSDRPEIRFWGASGLTTLARRSILDEVPELLAKAAETDHPHIAITAAEALCYLGETERGLEILFRHFHDDRQMIAEAATSSLETLGPLARPLAPRLRETPGNARARSVLINIGELPMDDLHRHVHQEGIEVNRDRRDWRTPAPNP